MGRLFVTKGSVDSLAIGVGSAKALRGAVRRRDLRVTVDLRVRNEYSRRELVDSLTGI